MEFLVEFEIDIPSDTPVSEVNNREEAEALAAAGLADEGHLLRVWKRPVASGGTKTIGLYRAESQAELDSLIGSLPLAPWMHVTINPLEVHPNDPDARGDSDVAAGRRQLPAPRLTLIYHLEITLGHPLDLGTTAEGHRRIVPQTGGTFTGPELRGTLLPGASADWQIVLPDGTAICSMSNREACATVAPRFSHGSRGVKTLTRASTRFASQPRSRQPLQASTG